MGNAHLDALSKKHSNLESQIDQEVHRPHPDDIRVAELKKQKLRLKDELVGHRE